MNVFNVAQVEVLPVMSLQVAAATEKDPQLSQVLRYTQPGRSAEVPEVLSPYWIRKSEVTIKQDCLLWGTRVVIPQKWQKAVLSELHRDHPGIVCMKEVARSYAWWEGIDKEILQALSNCKERTTYGSTSPLAMANQAMAKTAHRFCRTIPREDVPPS